MLRPWRINDQMSATGSILQQTLEGTSRAARLGTGRRSLSFLSNKIPGVTWSTTATRSTPEIPKKQQLTTLQEANPGNLPEVWLNRNLTAQTMGRVWSTMGPDPDRPVDERKAKLGKTLRTLQERLPTLLQSPLPSDILASNISLHLFPSTHPFLPTVSGRVAYIAALWTSPIAWNRLPLIGDVKLEILSERMVNQSPVTMLPHRHGAMGEQLVVRWRTTGKGVINWRMPLQLFNNKQESVGDETPKHFTGLFIFEFDKDGKVLSHTIEHVQAGGDWERGVGAKFVGLTDWLLGGLKGRPESCPAYERPPPARRRGGDV